MKLKSHTFFIFLLFVFLVGLHSEARLLAAQHVEEMVNHEEIIQHEDSFIGIEDDLSDLMGSGGEGCNEEDEKCLERRMIAEAHLDYIYTQHHKP